MKAKSNAVLIAVHIGAFSSPYQRYFSEPKRFHELLDESLVILKNRFSDDQLQWGRVCVTAFSAGYGGAREFLRNEKIYNQIDSLLLLDCPHTSYAEDRRVPPVQMEGFLRFASDASRGEKTFIMTHSEIVPGTYSSTTECADYLIDALGGARQEWAGSNEMGMARASRFDKGRFSVFGFRGDTAPDHMKHLHGMALFLDRLDLK